MNLETMLAVIVLLYLSYLGINRFEERRDRLLAFSVGISAAAILLAVGSSWDTIVSKASLDSVHLDPIGLIMSMVGLSMSPIIPSASLRKTAVGLSTTGVVASILGVPTWAFWLVLLALMVLVSVVLYFAFKRIFRLALRLVREVNR